MARRGFAWLIDRCFLQSVVLAIAMILAIAALIVGEWVEISVDGRENSIVGGLWKFCIKKSEDDTKNCDFPDGEGKDPPLEAQVFQILCVLFFLLAYILSLIFTFACFSKKILTLVIYVLCLFGIISATGVSAVILQAGRMATDAEISILTGGQLEIAAIIIGFGALLAYAIEPFRKGTDPNSIQVIRVNSVSPESQTVSFASKNSQPQGRI